MKMSKYAKGSAVADAVYTVPLQPLYIGNPLIEALSENQPGEAWYKDLISSIAFDDAQRKLPSHERIECVKALFTCFQPWNTHIEIAQKMLSAIKSGYISRNPLNPQRVRERNQLYDCLRARDAEFTRYIPTNATAPGFSIIGYSGMGKTSAINNVLSLYPQLISHSQYKGETFHHLQIVWMKLECPFDGSVKGLCSSFFTEFDRITGDNTYHKHAAGARVTTDQMIPQIAILAHRHSLGALVIDEIQNISAAKSGGVKKMLNFIVHLVNTIGVPVILLGTQETMDILSTDLKTARRNSGQQGAVFMDKLKKGSEDWTIFVRGIWKYQWLCRKTPLTLELLDSLNDASSGIVDAAVKLYAAAQIQEIRRCENARAIGAETITPQLIRSIVNSDEFKLLKKRLTMLQKPSKAALPDGDMALIKWDMLRKESDITEVLPPHSASSNAPVEQKPIERNEELQRAIAIQRKTAVTCHTALSAAAFSAENDTVVNKLKASGLIVSPDDDF